MAHGDCVHSGSANEGAVLDSAALGDAAADEDDTLAALLAAVPEVAIPSIAV